jgi:hypothetical protein
VTVKLAILKALASSPDRSLSVEAIRQAVRETIAELAPSDEARRLASLGDVDIFASRFVMRDGHGIYVTDEGIDLLHWLADPEAAPPPVVITTPATLAAVDATIGLDARMKIFDLDFRPNAQDEPEADTGLREPGDAIGDAVSVTPLAADETAHAGPTAAERRTGRTSALARKAGAVILLAGHRLGQLLPGRKRLLRGLGGAAVALLGAMVVVASTIAVIAYGQIRSLQSEVVALRRELNPAKERIARLEQLERSRRDQDAPEKPSSPKERLAGVDRPAEAPLLLSREESQLVRDYIKPAPGAGSALPPIGLGDPVTGPTFPVPSAVTEKVPKLIGATFTIRSGSIVIIRKDSRHADAVLAQN